MPVFRLAPADNPALRIGRFGAAQFGVCGALLVLWAVTTGATWDWTLTVAIVVCGAALTIGALPWGHRGATLVRLIVVAGAAFIVGLMPLYLRAPALFVTPALLAAYIGAALNRWWLVVLLPGTATLWWYQADVIGVRQAGAEAGLYLGLWLAVGSLAFWMRNELEAGDRALIAVQAEAAARAEQALAERARLASSLRDLVDGVQSAAGTVEGQSASIATSIDDLAGSSRAIADTAGVAEDTVTRIATKADESRVLIGELGVAGEEIVGVVDTITNLAQQTNLLALNATIESARAGDAGKGFAVVANEVKDLAQRTGLSASDIGAIVDRVHGRLDASASAMATIAEMVSALEADQTTLSRSVSRQTEAIDEISRAASAEAAGMTAISRAMGELHERANELDRSPTVAAPTTPA